MKNASKALAARRQIIADGVPTIKNRRRRPGIVVGSGAAPAPEL